MIGRTLGTTQEESKDVDAGKRFVSGALEQGKMEAIFVSSLENYKKINKDYPDLIMLYRDGVGSQISHSVENEVQ